MRSRSTRWSKRVKNRRSAPCPWWGTLRAFAEQDEEERGPLPPLTTEQVLSWSDAHQLRTGDWPRADSGPIAEAPGETWLAVEAALSLGGRDCSGGDTLAR